MKSTYRSLLVIAVLLLAGFIAVGFTPGQTATATTEGPATEGVFRGTMPVVNFDVSPPLRDMKPAEPKFLDGIEIIDDLLTGFEGPLGPQDLDPIVQRAVGAGEIPGPIVSFNGPANISGVQPPDPNGDVGPNHVVVMSNLSFQIFDKAGNSLYGPVLNNTLWAGFGGDCETDNDGDPIVLHDQFHDRWILSQFTASGPTYFNCIAISTTADPTGTYYRYAVSTGANFPDYPKYGVWSNAYYISTREIGAGIGAYAIEIADVISGNPNPTIISFLIPQGYNVGDGLLPADIDGSTLPPSDVAYFMGSMDDGGPYGAPQDALTLWKFTPDFNTPGNSSFVLANTIPTQPFDSMFGTTTCTSSRNCIPQPGTTNKIDILSYRQRPIWRLAYRNFGDHEALVTNQSVEATGVIAGNRWWEIRDPGGSPFIYQEGTYAPGTSDGIHRWMGSIAMDGSGNIAFAYSASSGTTFPSVWYTGRLASDPLGQMTLGEGSIVNGTGSQTSGQRWGDYSSLTVDPVDDCTFWAVNEWLPVSGGNWTLRVGAFKFDECGTSDFTLSATPASLAVCAPDDAVYTVNVGQVQGFTDQVNLSVIGNPAGTTTGFSVNPVTPPGTSDLTIGNTGAAAAGSYSMDIVGIAPTSTHTATVSLDLFTAVPSAPTLTSPANGATNVPVIPTFQWNAVAQTDSYLVEIATDAGFTNIVDSATVATNSYTPVAALAGSTQYFWRVTASNICGDGAVSSTFSFTTATLNSYCSAPALVINDNVSASDNLSVGNIGSLTDMNVTINASHTYVGDLIFTLTHQDTGTSVIMVDRPGYTGTGFGCSGNNVDAELDDEGTDGPVESQCGADPALFGNPTPNNPLSAFDGEDLAGTWVLTVSDNASGDTGTLNEWCLAPTATEPSAPSIQVGPSNLGTAMASDTVVTQTLTISNTGETDLDWNLFEDQTGAPMEEWSDNFDSYSTGQNLHGVGGWKGWGNSAAASASTSAAQALSAPNSVDILGASDLVHEYTGSTSGQWVYTTWQYIPSTATGQTYFILLNQYDDGGATNNWSTQICFDTATDLLYDAVGTTCTGTSTLSIVYDQWVEIRVEIDLDADTQSFYYDDQLLFADTWTGHVSGGGIANIGAVDLFANNASSVYYDDISLAPPTPTAVACDAPEDIPWLTVDPTSGTTSGGTSDDVTVTFDSTGLSSGTYTGTLCVESNDATNPLIQVPLTLSVEETTYGVALSGDQAETAVVGETVTYTLAVTNTGNAADTFDLSVASTWPADLSDTSVALGPGASATLWVAVTVPAGTVDGDADVATVTATSQAEPTATDSAALTTTADVLPTYGVELSADQAATGEAGTTVSYEVTVTNLGDTADTFDLSLSGAWAATLSDTSVTLAAGASTTVTVEVTVPADAADGDSAVTTVTATSQTDPTATDSSDLTTTAGVPTFHIFLPIVSNDD